MDKHNGKKKRKRSQTEDSDSKKKHKKSHNKSDADGRKDNLVTPQQEYAYSMPSVSHIGNKDVRARMRAKLHAISRSEKRKRKEKRRKEREELGDAAPPPQVPRTLDNTREPDETTVKPDDVEIIEDTAADEFADYFDNKTTPKIMITTSPRPYNKGRVTLPFIKDLIAAIPNTIYRKRKNFTLKQIIEFCKAEQYTDVIVINEDRRLPNSLLHSHLPNGPTVLFRLTNVQLQKDILNHCKATDHQPELILNNFTTRLGHTIARLFASIIPQKPEFEGRRVITFHNQRDFIFFRQHRYIFDDAKKARIQEIGPRFTLKLKYLQHGTFDSQFGEYEWLPKRELKTSRRRFFL